jgi:uncharacterized protein (DUF2252 family)
MASIYERIIAFNQGRLPDMVKHKYVAMAENSYRFYRGTCHLFYEDFSKSDNIPLSPTTWICGDLHLENYGSYKGDNRVAYFDMNDFDEALLAPCIWEVARMITSIFVAFENLEIAQAQAEKMAQLFLKTYAATLAKGKAISLDPRTANGIVCTFLISAEKRRIKDLLRKRTTEKKHKLSLALDYEKHFELEKALKKELARAVNDWIKTSNDSRNVFEVVDSVFRLAGTGSVGVSRYLFLLKSLNTKAKYLLLDMKQATKPSLKPYVVVKQPRWETEADRVIMVQQRMQNVLPALLGTIVFRNDSYVLQEMQPAEDTINFEVIKDRYGDVYQVIGDMAVLAASCQLRSSGRQGSAIADQLIAFGQNDHWHEAVLRYSKKYARQVKKDYQEYMVAYKAGKF